MKRVLVFVLVALVSILTVSTAFSQTLVSGEITDSNWTYVDSPYILMGDAYVDFNHMLEIGPGVVVYGTPEAKLQVYGTLLGMGTKGDGEILFSAVDPVEPWGGILLMSGAGATVDLTYTTVEYAYSFDRSHGGGINCQDGDLTLLNCTIRHNETSLDGGGIYLYNTTFDISYTRFSHNKCGRAGGGLDFAGGDDGTVHHVVFDHNHAYAQGGAIYFYTSGDNVVDHATLYNNTAEENAIDARFYGSGNSGFTNSIIWHEPYLGRDLFYGTPGTLTYSCIIDTDYSGEGVFYDDPLFVNAANGDFHLTADSPCIDAGDPNSTPDPDQSIADVGRYFFGETAPYPNELILELDPHRVLVPGDGGNISFGVHAFNNTSDDYFDLEFMVMVITPDQIAYGPYHVNMFDLLAGEDRTAQRLYLPVPAGAQSGFYTLSANLHTGGSVHAMTEFDFFKQAGSVETWVNPDEWGWDQFSDPSTSARSNDALPAKFNVIPATPNPFNASTVLTLELPQNDRVEVTVYDIRGRQVAELMNGTMASGRHSLSFNAQNMPSGAYFVRTNTAHLGSSIQKVMLIK
ncbi:T9SS type A sorting domain-containing protein [bacterium]|nr:T9SS type A sorting domain-containing protein [bacterium]